MTTRAIDDAGRRRALHDLTLAFAGCTDLGELVPFVMERCREVLDAEGVSILLLDRASGELYFPFVAERAGVAAVLVGLRFPADRGIAGGVLRTGRARRVDDVQADPEFYGGIDVRTRVTTRCLIAAPLVARGGTIGVVQAVNRRGGGTFGDDDLHFLDALAGAVAIAVDNAQLVDRLRTSSDELRAQVGALRRDLVRRDGFPQLIGSSPPMGELFRLMESAAGSGIAVLVEGETGSGKELVARGIHRAGARAGAPFVAVNCAALPETLLESELFGHRRGAFTGATHDQRGLFEAAHGGTILLDEVGDMPPTMQAKLLRVLQEGEVTPVGDRQPRRVDVRVISATNRDLAADVRRKHFREDLYYRIAVFPIRVPPLRARRDDIPILASHLMAGAAARLGRTVAGFDARVLELFARFDWPGNVRELQNEVERAVALVRDGEVIAPRHLSEKLDGPPLSAPTPAPRPEPPAPPDPVPLRDARALFEAQHIAAVLRSHADNVTRAAEALGVSRIMLQKKMKAYRLRGDS